MKNIILSSVVAALLMFTGCSDKDPDVKDPDISTAKEVKGVDKEVVNPNNAVVKSSSDRMLDMQDTFGSVYFAYDKFAIADEMTNQVAENASITKEAAALYNIKLEGNCDEWGSDEYNFALGLKRADSVKKALVAHGADASKITMVSYGESNPTCTDKTQDCWAKNRRVDFSLNQ